jgi:TonB family protein
MEQAYLPQVEAAPKAPAAEPRAPESAPDVGRIFEFTRKFEQMWLGGMRVDPEEQQKRITQMVRPVYPDVAKNAGIEGTVKLKIIVNKEGKVQEVKVLSGPPILVNAAVGAVQQWRYQPAVVDGKPVSVVTTITVVFRLQ